ncbi:hypothetical protein DT019_03345 [Streptomyces sp. SDr-06]|uniref:hypothetical protein n=1 Tax=Streptomyces sp. SDr-06 TaxID=2267702 RepID=UPI000DE86DC4|nr:hypothetical protein [Streptomyces sp. SDr-06]RCH70539.1 hypothetical protein DT019_03345 [Streptomyces sp. SDr-06]
MTARERLLSYALSATPNEVTIAKCEELADDLRAEVRAEVAADVHCAELPTFPAGERPELVAKIVRAVDVHVAQWGAEAPYGVAAVSDARIDALREASTCLTRMAESAPERLKPGLNHAAGVLLDMVTGRDKSAGGAS